MTFQLYLVSLILGFLLAAFSMKFFVPLAAFLLDRYEGWLTERQLRRQFQHGIEVHIHDGSETHEQAG